MKQCYVTINHVPWTEILNSEYDMKCHAIKADGYITSKIYLGILSLRIRIKQQTLKYHFSLSKESEGKKFHEKWTEINRHIWRTTCKLSH